MHLTHSKLFATAALLLVVAGNANANGINPPRPSATSLLTATCTERSGGSEVTIQRARVVNGGKNVDGFTFAAGGGKERIRIADIKAIRISGVPDSTGYADARVALQDGTDRGAGKILLKPGKRVLMLKGFRENRSRIGISLDKCREVKFSHGASGQDEQREGTPAEPGAEMRRAH